VENVEVDTRHFKGNAPGWVSIHLSDDGESWREVVSRAGVDPDRVNIVPIGSTVHASFLRLDIHPDGGVARLRVWGTPDPGAAGGLRLVYVNSLLEGEARRFFHTACSAEKWVTRMTAGRPYLEVGSLFAAAEAVFDEFGEDDWLEAFAGHPRIGERGDDTANREQAGTAGARESVLIELAEVNRVYEQAMGFTYIVFATGKTADEVLALAKSRLDSSREEEMAVAAGEQRAITATRLRRMLCMGDL
jgi:OHCU decarboxylase